MASPVEDIIPLMMEAHRFFELELPSEGSELCPIQKGVLSKFTVHYHSKVNNPERISRDLIQTLAECEQSPDNKVVGRLVELKAMLDQFLERVLQELSELIIDIVNGFISSPSREERARMSEYFALL